MYTPQSILSIASKAVLFLGIAVLVACSQASHQHEAEATPPAPAEASPASPAVAEQHEHEEAEAMRLNNGAKWKVNSEMMVHLESIKKLLAEKPAQLPEHKALAKKITAKLDELTASCTMKGEAHDELHKWLVPFIENVESYSEATTADEASAKLQALNEAMVVFDKYFE